MNEFRVLVCGGKTYDNKARVFQVLDKALEAATLAEKDFVLIHGGAKGSDWLSGVWASMQQDRVTARVYPADWKTNGKAAGPIRNKLMLTSESPHVIIAFKGGNGTAHMMKIGREAGIPVYEVKE